MEAHVKEHEFDKDYANSVSKKEFIENHKNAPHLQGVDLGAVYDDLTGKKEAPAKKDEAK